MKKTSAFGYEIDWHDNGEGKMFEKKVQKKIASLNFGILKKNHYLKFEKGGKKRRREIDAIFIDLPLVVLFEMKRIREDTSEGNVHTYLGKFKNTCYMLENEERIFFNVEPHLQKELGITGRIIWKHVLAVPNKVINVVTAFASSHNAKRKIDVDIVSIRQVKNYVKSLYL